MYVETMTPEQLSAEAHSDFKCILARIEGLGPKIRRAAMMAKAYPWAHTIKGTTANKNEYIARISVKTRKEAKNMTTLGVLVLMKMRTSHGDNYLLISDHCGGQKCLCEDYTTFTAPITIFTAHLIARYKERCGLLDVSTDIVEQLFKRSLTGRSTLFFDDSTHHGIRDGLIKTEDGYIYAVLTSDYTLEYKTFLTFDMLTESQRKRAEEIDKRLEVSQSIMKDITDKKRKEFDEKLRLWDNKRKYDF